MNVFDTDRTKVKNLVDMLANPFQVKLVTNLVKIAHEESLGLGIFIFKVVIRVNIKELVVNPEIGDNKNISIVIVETIKKA